jgi:hypothetical protein
MDANATSQQDMFGVGQYDTSTPLLSQPPSVADAFERLNEAMFESDKRLFGKADKLHGLTKKAIRELEKGDDAPAFPTIEIPEAASRKITAKTDEGRITSAARSVMSWINSGVPGQRQLVANMDQALALVRAKGAILDPDKIPGLDMDAARNDKAMGRSNPATEAVAQAYRQFYGLDDSLESIQPPTRISLDDGSPGPFEVEAELRERRQARAMEIIQRVTGLDDGLTVRFEDLYLKKIKPKEWGGDGKTMTRSGGTYNIQQDTMTLRAALQATDREWDEAAFHESWHRVQYLALSPKEAAVLDTNWARFKTSLGANHDAGGGIAYAETQAVAFQRYGAARLNGQDPIKAMLGGYQPGTTKLQKAANAIASAFDKVLDFVEKVHNAFSIGTFDSTRGIFERAYQGALKGDANFNFEIPGSGMDRMTDSFPNGGWRRSTWDYERSGGVKPADLELAVANIDTQIADLKSKALAGGC